MTTRTSRAFALLLVILGTACSDSPTSNRDPSPAGIWQGTWTSTAPGLGGTARLDFRLTQQGSDLGGDAFFLEHLCIGLVRVTGTAIGNQVTLAGVTILGSRLELRATLSSDGRSMSGTYSLPAGGFCPDEFGTWTIDRL